MLEKALALGTVVLALTIEDRERLFWALDDARADALAELRAVLLQEHKRCERQGLVQKDRELAAATGQTAIDGRSP